MRKFKEYVCFTKLAKELYLVQENLWTTCVRSPFVEGFVSLTEFRRKKEENKFGVDGLAKRNIFNPTLSCC